MKNLKSKQGFTLIELIIAVSFSSIFLVLLYGLYFQIQKVTQRRAAYTNRSSLALSSLGFIIKDINSMAFEPWNPQTLVNGKRENCALGTCTRLEMSVGSLHSNPDVLTGNVFRVTYFVEEKNGTMILFRRQDNFFTPPTEEQSPAIPMIENIAEFFIEYSPDGTSWQDEWDSAGTTNPQAPRIFRLHLGYKNSSSDGDKVKSFEFLVRPVLMSNQ